jgi:holin-like protein
MEVDTTPFAANIGWMIGLAFLLLFNLAGVVLSTYGRVPLPGNVIGLLLLLAALFTKVVKLHWIEDAAHLLLRHMLLFFAPVIVAALGLAGILARNLASIVAIVVVSTLVTAWVTAAVADKMRRECIPPDSP